ncbi:MAG: hypothetical protein OEV99_16760, partial [Nitrospira sp.]|nr:hypothetical protein [Nitrospira sp.]
MKIRLHLISRHLLLTGCGLGTLLMLLGAATTQGATYYVTTTGHDGNPGTSDHPWRNLQKCAASPIQAGDTCIVRQGT